MQSVAAKSVAHAAGAIRPVPQRGPRTTVRVACSAQQAPVEERASGFKALAAGLAAAALVSTAGPAQAGVILVQPEVKNFVKETPKAAAGSPAAKAAPAKRQAYAETSGGFNFTPLALPATLVAIAGAAAALSKADPEFLEQLGGEWSLKDSSGYAGYETVLKDTPFFGGSGSIPTKAAGGAPAKKAGTVAKKATKAGTKKGSSTFGSIFGGRD